MSKDQVVFVGSDGRMSEPKEAVEMHPKPQSAINEETGEINWDCPCLQGALEPPCGEYFRAAFSCFVASKAEPKGSDCLELFSAMQDCFRAHPEIYMKSEDKSE